MLFGTSPTEKPVLNPEPVYYYQSLANQPQAWTAIKNTLSQPDHVLLMGSSELTSDDPKQVKPFSFLNEHSPYTVLAVGHAGNQALSMFTQLMAVHRVLKASNIVIILSPIWYQGTNAAGTHLDVFLEYATQDALKNILADTAIPEKYKSYLFDYIAREFPKIMSPTPELKMMSYKHYKAKNIFFSGAYSPLIAYNSLLSKTSGLNNETWNEPWSGNSKVDQLLPETTQRKDEIKWDSLYTQAIKHHSENSSSNNWGIQDEYYRNYVHGTHGLVKTVPMRANRELKDLTILVDLLSYYKASPIFIMQSVNPFYYEKLDKFKVVDDSISKIIARADFPYFNMMEYDTTHYENGILTDVMHLGEYGWLKVNRFILENLLKNGEKN